MRFPPRVLGRSHPAQRSSGPAAISTAVLTGLWVLVSSFGCVSPRASVSADEANAVKPNLTYPADQRAAVFDDATAALRDAGYAIDRADYRHGVLTTRPRPVATALEPWGGLAQPGSDGDQAWAGTFGRLQRVVRVTAEPIQPDAEPTDAGPERLRVEVQLERYDAPQRRVINASRGRVFSTLSAVPEPLAQRGVPGAYWHPIGRDPAEEARLLELIRAAPDAD